jgi:hypothetical protein
LQGAEQFNGVKKFPQYGEYKVKLTAAPVDNQANTMLIKVLAEYLNLPKSNLKIVGGKSAKTKIVEIL